MYFVPVALMILWWAPDGFWSATGADPAAYGGLDVTGMVANLVPVTLGNIVGGGLLVGLVYWFVYLRRPRG